MGLQFGRAISIYLEQSTDATIKGLLPIPKLPLIQNAPQFLGSVLDGALRSGMVLSKALKFEQAFLNGRLNSLSRCTRVVDPARGDVRSKLQKSFHR